MKKRISRSGRTTWIEPDLIMENSTRKIELRPNYYPNSKGQEQLVLAIDVYTKSRASTKWNKHDEKSFSLSADTAENFFQSMGKFRAIIGVESETELIVADASSLDAFNKYTPQQLLDALGNALNGSYEQFQTINIEAELTAAIQSHLRYSTLSNSINNLRNMVSDETVNEIDFQKWFEQNYWALGNAYIARDEVRRISPVDEVDLILERTANGLRDILEIKKASPTVLIEDVSRSQFYFSSDVSKAIGQCSRYLEVFSQNAHKGLQDADDIIARQPIAIIVIGRSHNWTNLQRRALHRLNSHLHGIRVKTYDEIISEAEQLLSVIGTKSREIPDLEHIPF